MIHGNCLVFVTSGIGNALQAMPFLRALHAVCGKRLIIAASPAIVDLYQHENVADEIVTWDSRSRPLTTLFFRKGLPIRYSHAFVTYSSPASGLQICRKLGLVGNSIGYTQKNRKDVNLSHSLVPDLTKAEIDLNMGLLEAVITAVPPAQPYALNIIDEEKEQANVTLRKNGLEPKKFFLLHLGAVPEKAIKTLSPRLVADVCNEVKKVCDHAPILLVSGKEEKIGMENLRPLLPPQISELPSVPNLRRLAALIAESKGVIAADTGIAHMASAVGVPTLVFFGPTSVDRCAPKGAGPVVICQNESLDCLGCSENWEASACIFGKRLCLNGLPNSAVKQAVGKFHLLV